MHVGINALFLVLGRYGGIETYLRNLARELPLVDPSVTYTLFTGPASAGTFAVGNAPNFHEYRCPFPSIPNRKLAWASRLAYEYAVLPRYVQQRGVDVLFSPCFTAPARRAYVSVATIPDVQHEDHPENFPAVDRLAFTRVLRRTARTASHILTLSEYAKRRIIEVYGLPPERVTATPLAADPVYFTRIAPDEIARVRHMYGLRAPYLLSVATLHPHKNLQMLLEAYAMLKQTDPESPSLVLTGLRGMAAEAIERSIAAMGLTNDVRITGWVGDADMPALFQGASVFVLPSRYEGFGLPVLEAMASGVPVVTTTATSLPEVAGDAALLVDPDDREGFVSALSRILTDADLRHSLVDKGCMRARQFTWSKTAGTILDVLQRASNTSGLPVHVTK